MRHSRFSAFSLNYILNFSILVKKTATNILAHLKILICASKYNINTSKNIFILGLPIKIRGSKCMCHSLEND